MTNEHNFYKFRSLNTYNRLNYISHMTSASSNSFSLYFKNISLKVWATEECDYKHNEASPRTLFNQKPIKNDETEVSVTQASVWIPYEDQRWPNTPQKTSDDANPGTTCKTNKFCLIATYNNCS